MLPERYVPRKISKISKSDKKVSVVGKITEIKSDQSSFILSDDDSNVEINFDSSESSNDRANNRERIERENGKLVRAFCSREGDLLKLDVLQSLDGLDLNLSKTVDELYEKAGI